MGLLGGARAFGSCKELLTALNRFSAAAPAGCRLGIAVALLGLLLPFAGCAGPGGLAGRSTDLGLTLHDPFHLPVAQEHDADGASVITITAGDDGSIKARMRIQDSVSPEEAARYIAEQTALLLSIFESRLPPYPEFLTRESGCPQEFMPVEQSNHLGSYHVLYAGERFGYGVCTDDLARRRAAIGHFYCPDSRRLFSLEYFIPRDAAVSTLIAIFDSLRCRGETIDGGGR